MNQGIEISILPGFTREAEEKECMALAIRNSKERLANKTESAGERLYWLNRASEQELNELQKAKLRQDIELSKAKVDNLKSQEHTEELFEEAIAAITKYAGNTRDDTDIQGIDQIINI